MSAPTPTTTSSKTRKSHDSHVKRRIRKDGQPYKEPESYDKLLKTGTFITPGNKKHPSKEAVVELWEANRKNWEGIVKLRGYEVKADGQIYYYGPAYYDKLGDPNSCLNMALRRFNNPNIESAYLK